jgi:hypothetical protein
MAGDASAKTEREPPSKAEKLTFEPDAHAIPERIDDAPENKMETMLCSILSPSA